MRQYVSVTVTALVTATVLVGALAPPAQARATTVPDKRGDVDSSNDIIATKVFNGRRIGVRVTHVDLRRDVRRIQFAVQSRGTADEFMVIANPETGSYFVIDFSGAPTSVECPGLRVSAKQRKDVTKLSVPRACVGDPSGAVRLSPRVQWSEDGEQGDWSVNGNDHFTPYVRR